MNRSARAFIEGFEAAIAAVDDGNLHRVIVDALQSIIAEIPAADVVEVVRCKDCRFCMAFKDKNDGFYGHCRIWITRTISDYAAFVDADGYCSYGKRKEG